MTESHMTDIVQTHPNPAPHHDYLITLHHPGQRIITVRYVPDRLVLAQPAFGALCSQLPEQMLPEQVATRVLAQLADWLVPRWIEVTCHHHATHHRVTIAEHAPGWNNSAFFEWLGRV